MVYGNTPQKTCYDFQLLFSFLYSQVERGITRLYRSAMPISTSVCPGTVRVSKQGRPNMPTSHITPYTDVQQAPANLKGFNTQTTHRHSSIGATKHSYYVRVGFSAR